MVYTESYEVRKASSELTIESDVYIIEYIIKYPIDGKANEVNATFSKVAEGVKTRVGYGGYYNGATNVRFDYPNSVPFNIQSALNERFMSDMEEILK